MNAPLSAPCSEAVDLSFCKRVLFCFSSQNMVLRNGTEVFDSWEKPPLPVYTQFYFFNVTNPEEILRGEIPILEEVGPYTYRSVPPPLLNRVRSERLCQPGLARSRAGGAAALVLFCLWHCWCLGRFFHRALWAGLDPQCPTQEHCPSYHPGLLSISGLLGLLPISFHTYLVLSRFLEFTVDLRYFFSCFSFIFFSSF